MEQEQNFQNEMQQPMIISNVTPSPLFSRIWEMPNSNTFSIKCISKLIHKYLKSDMLSIDPFANKNKIAKITNDLNTEFDTDYHLDALDFLKQFEDNSIDFVLYDPPYSPRQVSECYKKLGKTVNMQTTQSSFWGNLKNEISRVTKPNGYVISFGWNSNGIGKTKGFELIEILLVGHGGNHNDTICTVERKRIIENGRKLMERQEENGSCSHEFVSREYASQPFGTCIVCGATVFS
jgi:hypothetical protein